MEPGLDPKTFFPNKTALIPRTPTLHPAGWSLWRNSLGFGALGGLRRIAGVGGWDTGVERAGVWGEKGIPTAGIGGSGLGLLGWLSLHSTKDSSGSWSELHLTYLLLDILIVA